MNFIQTLLPWANIWNALILILDITVAIIGIIYYKKTKSRQLLNSLPGLFTSLGLFGTFAAICTSLSGISDSDIESISKIGMTLEEAGVMSGDLDLKKIISDLIPAFSTSIYGLFFAFVSTLLTKIRFANEDAKLESSLQFKSTEELLEDIDAQLIKVKAAINDEITTNRQNNDKLTETIQAQSQIFTKFVDTFVTEMEGTFKAMKETIGERVSAFGEEQYKQSRLVIEALTAKLNTEASGMISTHNQAVKSMTETNIEGLKAMANSVSTAVSALQTDTVSKITNLTTAQTESLKKLADDAYQMQLKQQEQLKDFSEKAANLQKETITKQTESMNKFAEDSLALQKQQHEQMKEYSDKSVGLQKEAISQQIEQNKALISQVSKSLDEAMTSVISSLKIQCDSLKEAIANNADQLMKSYEFIDSKSSAIVSNYEQAAEAYRSAVQNAHDANTSMAKTAKGIEDTLKAVEKTNKGVNEVIDTITDKETNIAAIMMRIEELGKAIITLQRLESTLSKIASK